MTELDKKLQEVAIKNWEQFVSLVGKDAILSAKICLLRRNGYTYGQIQNKVGVAYKKVEYECKVCNSPKK